MKIKSLLTLLVLLFSQLMYAQKEANNWVFNHKKGITFETGKPVNALISGGDTWHSGGSITSNSYGRVIFYCASPYIIDSTHNGMPNGVLKNNSLTIQSSLIVPWPDSSHLYYVFTPGITDKDSLSFSIVNMNLRGGLGDVVSGQKNINLPSLNSGKVAAVRHSNRKDFWVVSPQGNSDTINAFLITSNGIKLPPVKSKTGIYINAGATFHNDYYGYLKLSPDGRKICNLNKNKPSMLGDFDASTGRVSNVWDFTNAVGLEFSTKNNILYVGKGNTLHQYDYSAQSKAAFLASRKTIDSVSTYHYSYASLQNAPDGKIYIYHYESRYLDVIHAPDSIGKRARFERDYFAYMPTIETSSHYGLPNFISSYFYKPVFGTKSNCNQDTVKFSINETYELDSVHWDFGDPASGTLNTSTQTQNVFHHYKTLGNYKVRLIRYHKTFTDTIYETFLLKPLKPNIGRDTNLCYSKYLLISADLDYASYKWSTAPVTKSTYITNPGTYHLTVTDYSGCKGSDTINVFKPIVKADFIINDSNQCLRVNDFILKERTTYLNGTQQKNIWSINDSIIGNDSNLQLKFKEIGSYPVKLISISEGGCRDSITKILTVNASSKVSFSINDSIQCLNNQSFDFKLTRDTGDIIYVWDLGDQSVTVHGDVIGKKYIKDSTYNVILKATTDKGCMDALTKTVTILPSPKADFTWDNVCSRTITKFQYTGTKPITSYQWNFNNQGTSTLENPSHQFTSAGTTITTLTVTSNNGCTDTINKTIEILPQSKADFTTSDVCETDSAVFINKSLDATSYNWRFGDGLKSSVQSPKHFYNIGGVTQTFNATLVAIANGGCSDSITNAVTVNSNPKSDFTYTVNKNTFDFSATQPGNTSYTWYFGNGDSAKSKDVTYTYPKSGTYKACLKTINAAGCSSQSCIEVSVTVGISSIHKQQGFKIYPNPNSGSFTLEIETPTKYVSIEVYDLLGHLIKIIETTPTKKTYSVDMEVADGIYMIRVRNGSMVWNEKVSVVR